MHTIRHRIGIDDTTPQAVYEQIATTEGLAQWWTTEVRGSSTVGDKIEFIFGAPDRFIVVEVVELTPNERVVWRGVDGPPEWTDTLFTFEIRSAGDDETVILFTQSGWREPVEFMYHCTSKWGSFLQSLKARLEQGRGRPFPDDIKLSSWD